MHDLSIFKTGIKILVFDWIFHVKVVRNGGHLAHLVRSSIKQESSGVLGKNNVESRVLRWEPRASPCAPIGEYFMANLSKSNRRRPFVYTSVRISNIQVDLNDSQFRVNTKVPHWATTLYICSKKRKLLPPFMMWWMEGNKLPAVIKLYQLPQNIITHFIIVKRILSTPTMVDAVCMWLRTRKSDTHILTAT